MPNPNPVPLLRTIGLVEGVSFLILLGVAMPLKYLAAMPMAVKIAGWIHGVLFMAFGVALMRTMSLAKWPPGRGALVFVAALLPFGPILIDRRIRAYAAEFDARRPQAQGVGLTGESAATPPPRIFESSKKCDPPR